ncbi:MAG: hypothetical protein AAGB22_10825, partial [Bacteroidota bacterium]
MNGLQDIKRMLLPGLKGLPIIAGAFILALLLAYRSILYTNPVYESTAKIKLDDIAYGISSANLYQDFDVFSNTNKIATEVEVIRSKVLIQEALQHVDFSTSYFRVGTIRTTEMYHNTPFLVEPVYLDSQAYDHRFDLVIHSEEEFTLTPDPEGEGSSISGTFGEVVNGPDFSLILQLNDSLMAVQPDLNLRDHYQFQLNSKRYIIDHEVLDNLQVVAVEEDVPVIRVTLRGEVAEKTSRFTNALVKTYIEYYVSKRTDAAGKVADFTDDQLNLWNQKLVDSEAALEEYRLRHNIINTRQETETDLRKIAQLKIQLANLDMNLVALD